MSNDRANLITPAGLAALRQRYEALFAVERPKLLDTIAWAAGNGDRSENGDYIYGRKRLREVDREINHLSRRMKAAQVIDPTRHETQDRVLFGATVTIIDGDERTRMLTLVGEDEADAGRNRISWASPIARALRGARIGDVRSVALPVGTRDYEVVAISFPTDA